MRRVPRPEKKLTWYLTIDAALMIERALCFLVNSKRLTGDELKAANELRKYVSRDIKDFRGEKH
ncbi:MAG: hypothetical protein OXH56_00205 [Gemmatimonadetes bacterium]|nr:hypothetical protein [Gemmatimonadota bacterium]